MNTSGPDFRYSEIASIKNSDGHGSCHTHQDQISGTQEPQTYNTLMVMVAVNEELPQVFQADR